MEILARVEQFIAQERLLTPAQRLVAGVSGGADSLCLLDGLLRLGYRPLVAHLDHGLRPESSAVLEQVRDWALEWGLEFAFERLAPGSLAAEPGSLEAAARRARYRFLASTAHSHGIERLAVGHTADDQVETILMHFLRGSGLDGLAGMAAITPLTSAHGVSEAGEITLIRPLLCLSRVETRAYCQAQGLQPLEDASNLDRSFTRNRIRHDLLPLLEDFNPSLRSTILRSAALLGAERDWLESQVDQIWPHVVLLARDDYYEIERAAFAELATPLARRLVRRMLAGESEALSFEQIELARTFLASDDGGAERPLFADWRLAYLDSIVVMRRIDRPLDLSAFPQLAAELRFEAQDGVDHDLGAGWQLRVRSEAEVGELRERMIAASDPFQAALDADRLEGELVVRSPEPGDRMQPLGMRGRVKLSDLFINAGVPQPARARWPLVCDSRSIVWVPGLRLADRVRLADDSRRAWMLKLVRNPVLE